MNFNESEIRFLFNIPDQYTGQFWNGKWIFTNHSSNIEVDEDKLEGKVIGVDFEMSWPRF